ncbi:tRNA pseudouridine(55) synthase TruB [Corynebacterium hansenii]|uniref:tRNA pseudouridine synthase B n=1 Tax=Corynebacterium hansenii TaxID=394964 RepID=A0ABV7ZTD1_9CORY|nr:tRNA pseudouridine(55) synthase TruB [Corynebacterium hansenii]WJY99775.1 tRNA pseudouridine synthase B [Corynebacterium hansenii]
MSASADTADPLADSGLVVVDKPAGMTSHDVVGKLRRIFGTRRVGHSGTLDPMATGVLVLGVNRGTRFLPHVHADAKSYDATIRLGASTVTDDAEGEVLESAPPERIAAVTDERIMAGVAELTGDIMQRPASVSAVRIDGVRAHERMRRGEDVVLPERPVTVSLFDVHAIRRHARYIDVDVSVDCSAGTFIRSLARDLGAGLGVGGHVTALRRTAAGPFRIGAAKTLEELAADPVPTMTLDEACLACFPVRDVTAEEGLALSQGKWLEPIGMGGVAAARTPDGRVVALITESGKRAKTVFVARPSTM